MARNGVLFNTRGGGDKFEGKTIWPRGQHTREWTGETATPFKKRKEPLS